jgi:hypothetical protein
MWGKLFNNFMARRELKALEKNPVYQAAFITIRETLADDTKGLGKYASQKFKDELAEGLIREVGEVVTAQNPIMANREKLAAYVLYQFLLDMT